MSNMVSPLFNDYSWPIPNIAHRHVLVSTLREMTRSTNRFALTHSLYIIIYKAAQIIIIL